MAESKEGKFKKKKVGFTQIGNQVLRDTSLSLKAKGLYSIIQSYITLEDFDVTKSFLMKMNKDGRDSFDSAWKELKNAGYLIQNKIQTPSGFEYEYELLDDKLVNEGNDNNDKSPHTENPCVGKADVGNPPVGEPDLGNPQMGNPYVNNISKINTTSNTLENNTLNLNLNDGLIDLSAGAKEENNSPSNQATENALDLIETHLIKPYFGRKANDDEIKMINEFARLYPISEIKEALRTTIIYLPEIKTNLWGYFRKILLNNSYVTNHQDYEDDYNKWPDEMDVRLFMMHNGLDIKEETFKDVYSQVKFFKNWKERIMSL